jgi:hypothetical protein
MAKDSQSDFLNVDLSIPMPTVARPSKDVVEIMVDYDEAVGWVNVTPSSVTKGTTVCFRNPKGGKLRIAFLSPTGDESTTATDSEVLTLTVGGTFHFKCYFTLSGATIETSPTSIGVIDVFPHRP